MKDKKIFIYTSPEPETDDTYDILLPEKTYVTHWYKMGYSHTTTIIFPENNPMKNLDINDLKSDQYTKFLKELDLLEL